MISPVFLFSYWIFAWFTLWYVFVFFRGVKSVICWNPFLALALALVENVLSWLWLIWKGADSVVVAQYFFMILLIKAFPLYLVWRIVGIPSAWLLIRNAKVLLGVFAVYCVVVFWGTGGSSPLVLYEKVMTSILRRTPETPLLTFFDWLRSNSR